MRECFCLFLFMLHFTEGYQLSASVSKEVTGYTGGSVLLPCFCTDPQSTVKFTWLKPYESQRNEVFKNESFKGRLKLFNERSPANLSLLISDLRKKDEGFYRCEISEREYKDIQVKIKGCDLDQNKQTLEVTGHSGESVVLPCSCTELQAKPPQLTWTYTSLNQTKPEEIYPNEQNERHRGRVKLLNQTSPGNLSLLISDLNTEDQGKYHCSVLQQQHVNIRLGFHVFILLSVLPVVMLLAVLALIYWKCRGRRDVKKMTNDGLVLVCNENENQGDVIPDSLTQGQNLKQDENEDEVTYTSVVHVKTAAKPADKQTVMEEYSEYASIK